MAVPSEQRNDEFSSEPWRVANSDREALLDWFLPADLAKPESIAELRRRTGRIAAGGFGRRLADGSVWLQWPDDEDKRDFLKEAKRNGDRVTVTKDWIPSGPERGQHVVDPPQGSFGPTPCPVERFVEFYGVVQEQLLSAHRQHHAYLERRRRRSVEPEFGVQFMFLAPFLEDVRLDAQYRRQRRGRRSLTVLAEPLHGEQRSLSFAGELALASFHRFIGAKESVTCPSCGDLEFFEDSRGRQICSKPECRRWYRAKWARADYAAVKTARKRQKR